MPGAANKLRELVRLAGPFYGEESITLLPDLDTGATGTMPSALLPDVPRRIVDAHAAGRRDDAVARYERYLPPIT